MTEQLNWTEVNIIELMKRNLFTWNYSLQVVESESESCSVVSDLLWPHVLYSPWNSPGQNTGVGILSLLQGIFPTQGLKPGLLHCRWILHQLSHKVSPKIVEWVAYPFSSRSSWPRYQTGVSCIAGGFLTNWAMREALASSYEVTNIKLNLSQYQSKYFTKTFLPKEKKNACQYNANVWVNL